MEKETTKKLILTKATHAFLLKGDPVYVDVFNYQFCIICVWGYVQCRLKTKRLKEHNYQWSRSYH